MIPSASQDKPGNQSHQRRWHPGYFPVAQCVRVHSADKSAVFLAYESQFQKREYFNMNDLFYKGF